MQDFTLDDLTQYNGKNGQPAYVAYKGVVYDVTESSMWGDGDHEGQHEAGQDLTVAHEDAPHEEYVVDYPEVGRLVES